jgi:hypothetical protein
VFLSSGDAMRTIGDAISSTSIVMRTIDKVFLSSGDAMRTIGSPLERNTWSIVLIAMEVDDIITFPIVLIASQSEVLLFS